MAIHLIITPLSLLVHYQCILKFLVTSVHCRMLFMCHAHCYIALAYPVFILVLNTFVLELSDSSSWEPLTQTFGNCDTVLKSHIGLANYLFGPPKATQCRIMYSQLIITN